MANTLCADKKVLCVYLPDTYCLPSLLFVFLFFAALLFFTIPMFYQPAMLISEKKSTDTNAEAYNCRLSNVNCVPFLYAHMDNRKFIEFDSLHRKACVLLIVENGEDQTID